MDSKGDKQVNANTLQSMAKHHVHQQAIKYQSTEMFRENKGVASVDGQPVLTSQTNYRP